MPGDVLRPIADALRNNEFQNGLVAAWSMKGFSGGSGHDHFFATFGKFGQTLDGRQGDALATVAARARAQNEQYLEMLVTPRGGDVSALANRVTYTPDFAQLRARMLAAGLLDIVPRASAEQAIADILRVPDRDVPAVLQDVGRELAFNLGVDPAFRLALKRLATRGKTGTHAVSSRSLKRSEGGATRAGVSSRLRRALSGTYSTDPRALQPGPKTWR